MKRIELSVILPCYNEEKNISELYNRCIEVFKKNNITGELIFINDGSCDGTKKRLESLPSDNIQVIHHCDNQGIERAWNTGLKHAKGIFTCLMDSDLQYQPEDIWRLYREIQYHHVDIVQGYRSSIGRLKDSRKFMSVVLNKILNIFFSMYSKDNKSGFILCRTTILEEILRHRFNYYYFQTFITISAKFKGFKIGEIETLFESRLLGESFIKGFPITLIMKLLIDLVKAFIEYRILDKKTHLIDTFLEKYPLNQSYQRTIRGWRRLYFLCYILLMPLHHWMISRSVKTYYDQLDKSQWLPQDRIKELQEKKLQNMITHAYYHVTYYRDIMKKVGLFPEDIKTIKDLQKLPLLSKKDVSQNLYFDLLSDNHDKRKIQKISTSGSTGNPFVFYVDKLQLEMRWAATLRGLQMSDYRFGQRVARLWHQTIGMKTTQIIKEKLDAFLSRRYFIPIFDLNKDNIQKVINKLQRLKPKLIDGYAESFNLLANYLKENSNHSIKVNAIVSSAQTLPQDNQSIIEKGFNTKVYDKYGSREFSGIAYQCEQQDGYHIVAENYIVEILKEGQPVKPNETGQVVITDLNNKCTPLIRYKIGDLAVSSDNQTCKCGRGLPKIKKIQGRVQSIVTTPEGNYIPGTFFGHFFKDYYYCIKQYQVIQMTLNDINLNIVKGDRFDESIFEKVLTKLKKYLGQEIIINVSFQKKIELTKTGKYQAVLSHVSVSF